MPEAPLVPASTPSPPAPTRPRSSRWRSGLALGLLWAVGLLLGARPAAAQTLLSDDGRVRAEVVGEWPANLQRGYVPVLVDVRNDDGVARDVDLTLQVRPFWSVEGVARRRLRLDPGEARRVELLAPATGFGYQGLSVDLSFRAGGPEVRERLDSSSTRWDNTSSNLLIVSEQRHPESEVTRIGETVLKRLARLRSGTSDQLVRVGQARPDELPTSWAAYTSLHSVALDLDHGRPSSEVLTALAAWVRGGGLLVATGTDARAVLAGTEAFAGALEPRFEVQGSPDTYALGLGRLLLQEGEATWGAGSPEVERLAALVAEQVGGTRPSWLPDSAGWRGASRQARIPGVGELPLQAFMALLLLFAVVIGPVNLVVLAKLKRPQLLLVTVPVLSLMASVAVLATGVFSAGLGVRTASASLTLLDQRAHQALVLEDRVYFAGLAPGGGLRLAAGTAVFPVLNEQPNEVTRYVVEQDGEGRRLEGSFVRVRDMVRQVIGTSTAARGRLRLAGTPTAPQVTNELPSVAVTRLILCDAQGAYWVCDPGIAPGATATLTSLSEDRVAPRLGGLADLGPRLGQSIFEEGIDLRPGTYVALLPENPWGDDTGLESERVVSNHLLYGVLDLEEGR